MRTRVCALTNRSLPWRHRVVSCHPAGSIARWGGRRRKTPREGLTFRQRRLVYTKPCLPRGLFLSHGRQPWVAPFPAPLVSFGCVLLPVLKPRCVAWSHPPIHQAFRGLVVGPLAGGRILLLERVLHAGRELQDMQLAVLCEDVDCIVVHTREKGVQVEVGHVVTKRVAHCSAE